MQSKQGALKLNYEFLQKTITKLIFFQFQREHRGEPHMNSDTEELKGNKDKKKQDTKQNQIGTCQKQHDFPK